MKIFSDKNKLLKSNVANTDKNAMKYFSKRSAMKNAMKYFSKRNDLVTTKANKGGTTVILDVKGYIAKANEQLQDNSIKS